MADSSYVLYQLGISHYCEKIRWALAYKQLPHSTVSLLPGQHMRVVRKLTRSKRTEVPVLKAGNEIITNSSDIITWLDERHPEKPLTPVDGTKSSVLEWEAFADEHVGDHVRRICYHTLLSNREVLIPLFSEKGPWYGHYLLKVIFPKLAGLMRQGMKIDEANTADSIEKLDWAMGMLATQRGDSNYLVGNSFTRADLAAAALFAPMCSPANYGHTLPERFPEPLAGVVEEFLPHLQWVNTLYQRYR